MNTYKNAQGNTNKHAQIHAQKIDTLYLYAVSCGPLCLWAISYYFSPCGPAANMNLFGPMIKRLKASSLVCVWDTVSACVRFRARKSLRKLQDILIPPKHCLLVSLPVAQRFAMSFSTNAVAFHDRSYPGPKPLPAHFSQAVCQPVLERLLSLYLHRI